MLTNGSDIYMNYTSCYCFPKGFRVVLSLAECPKATNDSWLNYRLALTVT